MKPLRPLLLLLPALLLTACASYMTDVQPVAGKDRYRVSYNAGYHAMSWVQVKNKARERAKAFCVEQGRRMVDPEAYSNDATGLGSKEATVVFTCEQPPQPAAGKP
ncbi:MAG TPA: hypothetical protein VF445_05390 [Bordetella sp.]|uniref:hypothetical protein n=1 Tax=Bordetella sp. TaxID=28081 RepID=UPI002ED60C7C